MTCLNHPDWRAEVHAHAMRVLERVGDGVFFDNIWMGATAWVLGGRLGGFAGCACRHCQDAFREVSGQPVPTRLHGDSRDTVYLRWRADVVARRLAEWGHAIRTSRPGAWVLANNCDVVLRDSMGLLGIDPPRVAVAQDALLVENIAMARYIPETRRLIANALPVKALQALVPDRTVLALTYEHGIGLDRRPSERRIRRALAEAVAVGASPVLKGSEFLDSQGRLTVLTAPDFAPTRASASTFLTWTGRHEHLYRDVQRAPAAGVYLDAAMLRERWAQVVPATFAVAAALLHERISFAFYTADDLRAPAGMMPPILVPPGVAAPLAAPSVRSITVAPDVLDVPATPSAFLGLGFVRALLDAPLRALARHYFGSARVRRLVDRSGLTARFLESPLFTVPKQASALRRLLGELAPPAVESTTPLLVERWRAADGTLRLHLVSYVDDEAQVVVRGTPPDAWYTPDAGTRVEPGAETRVALETYVVLEWRDRG